MTAHYRQTERGVHLAILDFLRWQYPGAVIFHPPNSLDMAGDKRAKAIAQNRAKMLGMLPGAADLIVCHKGRFWSFEVKSASGRLSDHQIAFGAAVQAAGGRWAMVRSVEDVKRYIAEWEADVATVPIRGVIT